MNNKEIIVTTNKNQTKFDLEINQDKKKIYRVAIYVRLSEEDEFKEKKDDDSESIQNQKSLLMEYAMKHPDWEIVGIYSDDDYSGADCNRPDWNIMLKRCEKREIDIVLCKTQSRFSRDMEVIEKYLHNKFIEWNIRFISIIDNVDTAIKGNKKARQINGLINEWYLEDMSDNIKAVLKHKKQSGQFTGSFAPYGYLRSNENKHQLIVDPDAKEVVKKIFELYASGKGYSTIAMYLTQQEIPTPSKLKKIQGSKFVCGKANGNDSIWKKDTIRKILTDQTYIGNLVQGKVENYSYKNQKRRTIDKDKWIVVEGTHEPIIDKETWTLVQKKFEIRGTRTSYKTGEIHLFSKKVYCNECGKSMARNNGYNKHHSYAYLRCRTRASNGLACSNCGSIRYDYMEKLVLEELNKFIVQYKDNSILENSVKEQYDLEVEKKKKIEYIQEQIKKTNLILSKKKTSLKSLYQDKEDGILSIDEFLVLKSDWAKDITQLENQMKQLEIENMNLISTQENKEQIQNAIKEFDKVEQLTRQLVDTFIHKIYVSKIDEQTNKRTIRIEWNF